LKPIETRPAAVESKLADLEEKVFGKTR